MGPKELTTEQKQEKFFRKILYLAKKSEMRRIVGLDNVKYKEINLLLSSVMIEEIEEWADDLKS